MKLKEANKTIDNYKDIIIKKDTEIEQLKKNVKQPEKIDPSDLIVVNFISNNQSLFFAIATNKKETFASVEEKLYQQYPEYRKTNNSFLFSGRIILRFQTIEENKIVNGLPVTLIVNE